MDTFSHSVRIFFIIQIEGFHEQDLIWLLIAEPVPVELGTCQRERCIHREVPLIPRISYQKAELFASSTISRSLICWWIVGSFQNASVWGGQLRADVCFTYGKPFLSRVYDDKEGGSRRW